MERYLFILIILFITVGLFITKTSKLRCEKFKNDDKELRFLNQNIDFINKKCNSFGYDTSLLNLN